MNKDEESKCMEALLERQKIRANSKTPNKSDNNLSMNDEDKSFINNVTLVFIYFQIIITITKVYFYLQKFNRHLLKI